MFRSNSAERKWLRTQFNSTHLVFVLLIDAQVFLFPSKPLFAGLHPDNSFISSWRFPDVDHEGTHSETEHVVKESHALGPQQSGADQPRLVSLTFSVRLYVHVWSEAWNERRPIKQIAHFLCPRPDVADREEVIVNG